MNRKLSRKIALIQPKGMESGHYSEYTYNLGKHIVKTGIKVDIVSYDGIRISNSILSVIKTCGTRGALKIHFSSFLSLFLSVYCFLRRKKIDRRSKEIFSWLVERYLLYDGIVFVDPISMPLMLLFSISRNIPIIIMIEIGTKITLFNKSKLLSRVWRRMFKRHIYRKQMGWVLFAEQESKQIETLLDGQPIARMPCWPVETRETIPKAEARSALGLPLSAKIFLVYGVTHAKKNYQIIFEALGNIKDSSTLLIIAGDLMKFKHQQDIFDLLDCLDGVKKEHVIIFDEYIVEDKEKLLFCASDASIVSYRKYFNWASGTVAKSLEYLTPVIASLTASTEVVSKRKLGLTFEAENASDFVRCLNSFSEMTDYELNGIVNNIMNYRKENGWFNAAQQIQRLLISIDPQKVQ